MSLESLLQGKAVEALTALYGQEFPVSQIQIQDTRKDFEGDFTLVVFALLRISKKGPEQTAEDLGQWFKNNVDLVEDFNVIKGFLNLVLSNVHWSEFLKEAMISEAFGHAPNSGNTIMLEYSSPNTNKPLHLGHIRNNLLGYSVARILEANGNKVVKVNLVNDRGIHICKSMLAWQKFGAGETPESATMKGDKLVGKYYVRFDQELKAQSRDHADRLWSQFKENRDLLVLEAISLKPKEAEEMGKLLNSYDAQGERTIQNKDGEALVQKIAEDKKIVELLKPYQPLMVEAQEMLRQWEAKDTAVVGLWKKMNDWVYSGFDTTYTRLGVAFDQYYYESDTYILGKEMVSAGLEKGTFYQKEDGSIWCSLEAEKLTDKLLLRSDGTSVYMTQDLGTAIERFREYPDLKKLIYTVGNEQNHHFTVLFTILAKLGHGWAKECRHLSYGMVDLPSGKMKSREGTVVDADDLMDDIIKEAESEARSHDRFAEIPEADQKELFRVLGLGALKYFILKVDPKRKMMFNPAESVALQGDTGPFIQYSYARTQALKRRASEKVEAQLPAKETWHKSEKGLVKTLAAYPKSVREAAEGMDPSVIANYAMDLVKSYNRFYHDVRIFHDEVSASDFQWRIQVSNFTGEVIRSSMSLLGVAVPDKM